MTLSKRSSEFIPLEPTNLRHQARAAIRTRIATGDVIAGEIYPVAFFATQLGVSSTPVREALFDLAHEGLVELVRNRGFRVVELSEHDLDEIFEMRIMLEVPSAVRAAGKLSTRDIAACDQLAEQTEECAAHRDLAGFLEADREFHLRLIATLQNGRLVETIRRLRDETRLYGLSSLAAEGTLMSSAREHRLILDAVQRGDVAETESLLRRHLEHTRGIWAGREEPASR